MIAYKDILYNMKHRDQDKFCFSTMFRCIVILFALQSVFKIATKLHDYSVITG